MAASQSTWCWLIQECTAIPFLRSFFFTAVLCSLIRFSKVLPVSPMYTHGQFLPGTTQTTPFFFLSGPGFTFTSEDLKVLLDDVTVFTPRGLHIFSIHSLTPLTYGMCRSLGGVSIAFYNGVGWYCSASQVVLHYCSRVAIGHEHLPEMLDLLPSLSSTSYLLSSDS